MHEGSKVNHLEMANPMERKTFRELLAKLISQKYSLIIYHNIELGLMDLIALILANY